jgi:hypothetical protein
MRRHTLAFLPVSLIAVLLLPGVASANFQPRWDPDDAPGQDLHKVEVFTSGHGKQINGNLTLWDGSHMYSSYAFEFDSRGDEAMDFVVNLSYDGGSSGLYTAGLYRADGTDTGAVVKRTCDDYSCWFPFSFPIWRLHATKHIQWRVRASGLEYGQLQGADVAPNAGWYRR